MKKKLFFGFAVLTFAAVVTFTMSVNSNDYGLSNIALTNVEALAQSEGGSGCQGCLEWRNIDDKIEGVKCKSDGCTEEYKGWCQHWCGD